MITSSVEFKFFTILSCMFLPHMYVALDNSLRVLSLYWTTMFEEEPQMELNVFTFR